MDTRPERAMLRAIASRALRGALALAVLEAVQVVAAAIFVPRWLDPVALALELVPALFVFVALEATESRWCRGAWTRSLAFFAGGVAAAPLAAIPPVWFPALLRGGPVAAHEALAREASSQLWLEPGLALAAVLVVLAHVRARGGRFRAVLAAGLAPGVVAGALIARSQGAILGALAAFDLAVALRMVHVRPGRSRFPTEGRIAAAVSLAAALVLVGVSLPRLARQDSAARLREVAWALSGLAQEQQRELSAERRYATLEELLGGEGYRLELATDSRAGKFLAVANPGPGEEGPGLSVSETGIVLLHAGRAPLELGAPAPPDARPVTLRRYECTSAAPARSILVLATDPCRQ
jgi:hypothetical protein